MLSRTALLSAGLVAGVLIIGLQASDLYNAMQEDRSIICARGHSETLRLPVREYYALRDAAFARAGIPTSMQCHRDDPRPDCLVVDHIVPLELCTAADDCNRGDNIQIQTKADAEAKDHIENEMRHRYCKGELSREQAISRFNRSTP